MLERVNLLKRAMLMTDSDVTGSTMCQMRSSTPVASVACIPNKGK